MCESWGVASPASSVPYTIGGNAVDAHQVGVFVAKWRHLRLTDADLSALEQAVMADPDGAPAMAGTGGLRKLRFAPPSWSRGKSGATRVCYIHLPDSEAAVFVTIYSKSEKANLTPADRASFRALIDRVREGLGAV